MIIQSTRTFKKQFKKLPLKFQEQFETRLRIFVTDRSDPRLRIHPLKGSYFGYWSMDVNGGLRAIYKDLGDHIVLFAFIGTHNQLYG